MKKVCRKCGGEKVGSRCRPCWAAYMREYNLRPGPNAKKKEAQKALYRRDEPSRRSSVIKANYGIDIAEFNRMLAQQNGVCAVCDGVQPDGRRLAIDHCHKTGAIRGLLCSTCNTSIGHAKDDPTLLRAMADYLERSRSFSQGNKMQSARVN
jgi:hypothetical protein